MRANKPSDFWAKVDRSGGPESCWPWTASRGRGGYGNAYYTRWKLAHRVAFFITYGFYPPAVCHSCDNPPCCNPGHLFAGTKAINNADRDSKGRQRTNPKRGDEAVSAKLDCSQVLKIKDLFGKMKSKDIAELFGVTPGTICDIKKGRTWTHL